MDSKLDGIFRTTFRTTEQTDSWLGIRRDEERGQGRKDHEKKDDDSEFSFDDDAHVSVSALYVFLRDLLVQADVAIEHPAHPDATANPAPPDNPGHDPAIQRASMAANAYQATARSGSHSISISDAAPPPPPTPTGPKVTLTPEEMKTIQTLMLDLDRLAQRGIATLTIRKADTFLQSLQDAVHALAR